MKGNHSVGNILRDARARWKKGTKASSFFKQRVSICFAPRK
jgi:hypothetical protein